MKHGWDFKREPHYWRKETDGALVTLCQERARPDSPLFELREGMLPRRIAKACPQCMACAIRMGLPTREPLVKQARQQFRMAA
ncbi:MAG TPA: hypothetical protein VF681_09625 [Abditibacteriaceae bacterium]|jgi:hypothetical protein